MLLLNDVIAVHIDNLEALECLALVKKIEHWSGQKPWKGLRTRNVTVIRSNEVSMDEDGNIIRMPSLIGKPCFAQITAFVRHGEKLNVRTRNGGSFPTRCSRCNVRDACEKVCMFRVRTHPEMQNAYSAFLGHGGTQGLNQTQNLPLARSYFDRLVRVVVRHGGFSSCNDQVVADYYDEERAARRAGQAQQKREERLKKIGRGELDDEFESLLARQRKHRIVQLGNVAGDLANWPHLPTSVRRMPEMSIETTADAWLARVVLQIQRQVPNASAVAREMMRRRPDRYKNHNSLRQRVESDLARVDALERLQLPSRLRPVWERFNLAEAVAECEAITHYSNLAA